MKNTKSFFAAAVLTFALTAPTYADGLCYLPGETPTGPPCGGSAPATATDDTNPGETSSPPQVDYVSLAEIALESLLLF